MLKIFLHLVFYGKEKLLTVLINVNLRHNLHFWMDEMNIFRSVLPDNAAQVGNPELLYS